MRNLAQAEAFLHANIPLTQAMGVRVVAHPRWSFAIEAPVALNHNHLHTAFGGSINAVATLAAYTFLWLRLPDTCPIVVRESTIRFVRPARQTIRAFCLPPPEAELARVTEPLAKSSPARILLRAIVEEQKLVAEFSGTFVVLAEAKKT
jgi:thioesterase domain-containing protein